MLSGIHTTDLGAVALSSVIGTTASHTLDKYHFLRRFSVGETFQMAACRTCCVHDTFQFQRGDNIFTLAVCIFIVFVKLDGIETCSNYDGTIFLCYDLILLIVFNGSCLTYLGTHSTFSGFKLDTVLTVNNRNIWDGLCKRSVNSGSVI